MYKVAFSLVFIGVIVGCNSLSKEINFKHNIVSGPVPWSKNFELRQNYEFTFAIIGDLNGGERRGVYSTAIEQLNLLDPDFVLSVGDLIDGGTKDSLTLTFQWDFFDSRTSKLHSPFFYLGGNHDLTNIEMRAFWKKRYGHRYYHFIYKNVLFLMLDSEDYSMGRMEEIYNARVKALKILSGEIKGNYKESKYYKMPERTHGAISTDQINYFKSVIEENPSVDWIFVLMHKPLWMREDEKGLGPLEHVLQNRPYTLINGHFHSLSHRKRKGENYIMLGTTGGSQSKTDSMAIDHITLVKMKKTPTILHLKMEGILDQTGKVPIQEQ